MSKFIQTVHGNASVTNNAEERFVELRVYDTIMLLDYGDFQDLVHAILAGYETGLHPFPPKPTAEEIAALEERMKNKM